MTWRVAPTGDVGLGSKATSPSNWSWCRLYAPSKRQGLMSTPVSTSPLTLARRSETTRGRLPPGTSIRRSSAATSDSSRSSNGRAHATHDGTDRLMSSSATLAVSRAQVQPAPGLRPDGRDSPDGGVDTEWVDENRLVENEPADGHGAEPPAALDRRPLEPELLLLANSPECAPGQADEDCFDEPRAGVEGAVGERVFAEERTRPPEGRPPSRSAVFPRWSGRGTQSPRTTRRALEHRPVSVNVRERDPVVECRPFEHCIAGEGRPGEGCRASKIGPFEAHRPQAGSRE